MSNVIIFPKLPKLRRPKPKKPMGGPTERFCAVTARRLRSVLARVLEVLDSLERLPRRP